MKSVTKITFTDNDGNKFFGEGPCRLLRCVEKTGSLRAAAMEMEMAYSKASRILKQAESALGYSLTMRSAGGRDGGGSILTLEGKRWLTQYEAYRDACIRANQELFRQYFPRIGCVIMASGLGKRFGGNKLLADFHGRPMISRILDATEGIFAQRVVVTRSEDVAVLCRNRGIKTILHSLPHRSDTVRLGLEAMPGIDRCMFATADQPLLRRDTVAALALTAANDSASIWRTIYEGALGSPVVFPKWAFPELLNLPEGKGGGVVIKKYPERLRTVSVRDMYELKDVDSPEDLEELLER